MNQATTSTVHANPSGASHEVGLDELFFSTTDRLGVIEQANSVFVRLSRYPRERLVGAPHNIIRHPQMPGGAFRVMWDTLQAGDPFGAYVHNLAADGSRYDVFATITPLGDGYLSVRTRPMCSDVMALVDSLYADAAAVEEQARAAGASRYDAAELGAQRLASLIADAGIGTYNDFLMDALPREVRAREAMGTIMPERPEASGPLRELLDTVAALQDELGIWMQDLGRLSAQVADLREATQRLLTISDEAADTSEAVNAIGDQGIEFRPLLMPLTLWAGMDAEVRLIVAELVDDLTTTSSSAARTRFRIALARLHATMIGNFTAELIDGVPGSLQAGPGIGLLVSAIAEGITVMNDQAAEHARLTGRVADAIDQVAGLMQMPIDLLGAWLTSSSGRQLAPAVSELLPRLRRQVSESTAVVEQMTELGAELRTSGQVRDSARLRTLVARLSAMARPDAQQTGTATEQQQEPVAPAPRRAALD